MKKLAALILLLVSIGWAAYVFGFSRTADARIEPEVLYRPDRQLPEFVRHLYTLQTRMQQQMELLEHAEKMRQDPSSAGFPAKPLRDPFSS